MILTTLKQGNVQGNYNNLKHRNFSNIKNLHKLHQYLQTTD